MSETILIAIPFVLAVVIALVLSYRRRGESAADGARDLIGDIANWRWPPR